MTFRAEVHLAGKTATGIQVPDEVVAGLGRSRRPAVQAAVRRTDGDGEPYLYRTTVAPMGGAYWIPLSAENRTAAGLAAGDAVEVDLTVDDAPRVLEVPDDLRQALDSDAEAAAFFATLSFSKQRAYVDWVTSAKKQDTRDTRVGQAVVMLQEHRTR